MMPSTQMQPVGALLRHWRERRRLTQLDLALEADISPRHLSFVETGRAQPSREMLLHLSQELDIPLRERNTLLVAAGFAPMYRERRLDEPALAAAREAIDRMLAAQRPYPAFALDRHWNIAASNGALPELYEGVGEELLKPPVNALRLSLDPRGIAPRIANLAEWRAHLLGRLHRQIELTADPVLEALMGELVALAPTKATAAEAHSVLVPLQIRTSLGLLSFFSTTTVFGTPVEVTLSELAVELFFPADEPTAEALKRTSATGA
jgi:transcriptional regulator with XRE-family HTH domain